MQRTNRRATPRQPNQEPQDSGGPNLGECLRQFRFQRRLSMTDVSVATGLSKSTLSRIESDQASLTYDKLLQLCRGLQIDFATLFSLDRPHASDRPLTRRTVTQPGEGRAMMVNLQSYNYLCTELAGKKMTPMTGVIQSRTLAETNGLMKHDGEEFTFVLDGKLELHTEFYEPLIVNKGGSVYFDSTMRHAYVSVGTVPLTFLCVCSTPEHVLTKAANPAPGSTPAKRARNAEKSHSTPTPKSGR